MMILIGPVKPRTRVGIRPRSLLFLVPLGPWGRNVPCGVKRLTLRVKIILKLFVLRVRWRTVLLMLMFLVTWQICRPFRRGPNLLARRVVCPPLKITLIGLARVSLPRTLLWSKTPTRRRLVRRRGLRRRPPVIRLLIRRQVPRTCVPGHWRRIKQVQTASKNSTARPPSIRNTS